MDASANFYADNSPDGYVQTAVLITQTGGWVRCHHQPSITMLRRADHHRHAGRIALAARRAR